MPFFHGLETRLTVTEGRLVLLVCYFGRIRRLELTLDVAALGVGGAAPVYGVDGGQR